MAGPPIKGGYSPKQGRHAAPFDSRYCRKISKYGSCMETRKYKDSGMGPPSDTSSDNSLPDHPLLSTTTTAAVLHPLYCLSFEKNQFATCLQHLLRSSRKSVFSTTLSSSPPPCLGHWTKPPSQSSPTLYKLPITPTIFIILLSKR